MLFFVYRSVLTTLLVLATVLIEMSAARGLVAFLGNAGVVGLSTYATNLLTLLVIAAGTDYAIFFVGRYQEARGAGEDRETAFYTMYHGTTHIVLGSGLTVAGAVACLGFTRLPTSRVADMLILDRSPRPCTRRGPGADHHQAAGHPARSQLAGICGQQPEYGPGGKPDLPTRSCRRPTEAGRGTGQYDQRPQAAVRPAAAVRRYHPRRGPELSRHHPHHPGFARQNCELRRLFPAGPQLLLLGEALLRHSRLLRVSVALRRARRHRPANREVPRPHRDAGQTRRAAAQAGGADTAADPKPADPTAI